MMYVLPLANDWFSALLFLVGIALLTAILLRRTYRQVGRGRRGQSTRHIEAQPRPAHSWDGARDDPHARIEREKVLLEEFRREANGQIDSKIIALRQLIAQSEQQIARLEALLAEISVSAGSDHPDNPHPDNQQR
jgi:hypothetical protein